MAGTLGASARDGLILPLGEKEGGGEGGDNHILWSPLPGTECAQASLATARALQNSGSVESMCFGKVHFAQEPRKTEDAAASALKSRARVTHRVGGRRAGLRAGHSPALEWAQAPSGARPLGQLEALCRESVCCGQHPQRASPGLRLPSLFRRGSVPKEPWIK